MGERDSVGRTRIGYPHVVSTLALFIALGTGAYAVDKINSGAIQNNTIVSKDLRNNKAVKGTDVVDSSLGGADITDGGLGGADVADAGLTGADIADGGLTGADIAGESLTANQIDESTLGVAKAWAEITPGGGVRAAFGITANDVSHPTNVVPKGIYCIALPAENVTAVGGFVPGLGAGDVTIYSRTSLTDGGGSPVTFGCPEQTPWVVITHQSGAAENSYFHVLFH